jgi:Peptidase inhibitor I78 family
MLRKVPDMRSVAIAPAVALLLGACATTAEEPPVRELPGECNAASVQDRLGQRATAELGGTLLRLTGAQTLRWVPPRTAVTMDFRADRLTVSYNDDMVIERISCG